VEEGYGYNPLGYMRLNASYKAAARHAARNTIFISFMSPKCTPACLGFALAHMFSHV
jgi:hypothetical protein